MDFKLEAKEKDFKVVLHAEDFKEEDKELLQASIAKMAEALSSDEFKEFCLNYSYKGKWRKRVLGFRWDKGLERDGVYEKIMKGKEKLSGEEDNTANIFLKLSDKKKKGVLGYTKPNTRWQWIYPWFFKKRKVNKIAGNLAHEWMHKLGFSHERRRTKRRKYTVPYAVGYFVRDF